MLKSFISLEIRVLLLSDTKTFCNCPPGGAFTASCPVCRGEYSPDALPVPNSGALRKAYLLVQGLGGVPARHISYERKLFPAESNPEGGPLLSRLSLKLGQDAFMDIMFHRRKKRIRISEIRLEEDAGRLSADTGNKPKTKMDYSRAGMPSLLIRTEADFEIGEETAEFLSALRRRIQYLEILSGSPAGAEISPQEAIRCNAYVALASYPGSPAERAAANEAPPERPPARVKLRNLNSFNFVWKAVNTELSRQEEIVSAGGTVVSESRLWNEAKSLTEPFQVRAAEKPRYELPWTEAWRPAKDGGKAAELPWNGGEAFSPGPEILEALDNFTVELPEKRRDRFVRDLKLTGYQADFICDESSRAGYFEKLVSLGAEPGEAAGWMASWVLKELRKRKLTLAGSPLSPERFAAVLLMLKERRIHGSMAKQIVNAVLDEDRDPQIIIKERNWELLTDPDTIKKVVVSVIEANPDEVRRIREGDAGPIKYLTGLIMKASGGLAEPALVKDILREELSVSLVYVLSMGGAITGRVGEDESVRPAAGALFRDMLDWNLNSADDSPKVRFENIQVGRVLSEEIVPSDWAALIETIAE
ncbi:MAG: glutamyl-tRNA amidotransferase, partial [Spirochaetales bacterium]|nr:glutamyl-tRNA amidotransferase [Spirochaetales bacterium]